MSRLHSVVGNMHKSGGKVHGKHKKAQKDPRAEKGVTATGPVAASKAPFGRFGDSQMAHTEPGEVVVPKSVHSKPAVRSVLQQGFSEEGLPMDRYTVGSDQNSENPDTGEGEYFNFGGLLKAVIPAAASMIPGVGQIAGPILGGLMGGAGGSSGGGTATGQATTPGIIPNNNMDLATPESKVNLAAPIPLSADIESTTNPFETKPLQAPLGQNVKKETDEQFDPDQPSTNPLTGAREYFDLNRAMYKTDKAIGAKQGFGKIKLKKPQSVNPVTGKQEFYDTALRGGGMSYGGNATVSSPAPTPPSAISAPPTPVLNTPKTNAPSSNGVFNGGINDSAPSRGTGDPRESTITGAMIGDSPAVGTPAPAASPSNGPSLDGPRVLGGRILPTYGLSSPSSNPYSSASPPPPPAAISTPAGSSTSNPAAPAINKPAASPYDTNLYTGAGRNDRENQIRNLGYSGAFGQGLADQWLTGRYGTTNLDQIPKNGQSKENTDLNNLLQNYYAQLQTLTQPQQSSGGATPAPATATTPVNPAATESSSLSPYRPVRFRSRHFKGNTAANFQI